MSDEAKRPTIARIWRGRTRRRVADEYEAYNYEDGIKPLIAKAMGVQTLREDRSNETEFVTISYWESVESMARFTGDDPTRVHHLERDSEYLIELPKRVQILRLRTSHGDVGGNTFCYQALKGGHHDRFSREIADRKPGEAAVRRRRAVQSGDG